MKNSLIRISVLAPTSKNAEKTLIKLRNSLDVNDPVWFLIDDIIYQTEQEIRNVDAKQHKDAAGIK